MPRQFSPEQRLSLTAFEQRVLRAVARVPRGWVTTYRALACAIGVPGASRAIGNALHKNPTLVRVPCHRVIRTDGQLGGYRGGVHQKQRLLVAEGAARQSGEVIRIRPERMFYFSK